MTKPWSEIVQQYAQYPGDQMAAMELLARQIENSRYARGLFPWTSVTRLCIAQTPAEYPYDGPYLRIEPLAQAWGAQMEFRYFDNPSHLKQWHRKVDSTDGFAQLERFIQQLHWFA